ncbi:Thermolysin metallopeptidase, catalytic domain [Friedmanniella luteola]|uniref:Neutral metalloproteinase n=1 Tax=Friedmanniella luteola TaxID=546871 RepID=A0A1H1ZAG5_9ACTN|nr:protealysin inhibitor emfourin [Friedmanniella luteola]SDT30785.1 Thermolysin metallopeptidase, catalytic domain [Friedmanniella luteola]
MTCYFIPPYLLDHLASTAADTAAGAFGRSTLALDQRLREQRTRPTPLPRAPRVRVDASTERRVVHSAGGTETLPGTPVRSDDDPASGDAAVDEAFESSGQVWDLFAEVFDRRSVDGEGTTLSVTVHYGQRYDNAFWDGSQLVFGDGDGEVFDRFTKPMDVMAHEFTHGVTQFSAGLTYQGQSGALNESVSDVFAALTKQRVLGQDAGNADWLIGEGLFRPGVAARALRSMLEPGTAYDDPQLGRDPQVGSMADYVDTEEDNGGVHLNSGIPNRAFALAAVALGGPSWEQAGRVWYDTLTGGAIGADVDFTGFAEATLASAGRLFADDATVEARVRAAWVEVGVLAPAADGPTAPPVDAVPAEPAPPAPGVPVGDARTVAVRRSGGFAGGVRAGELDLDGDPQGPEVRQLLLATDLSLLAGSAPAPDRFVYTVAVGDWHLTVPEQDLTPELDQVVRIVLGGSGRLDLG